MHKILNNRSNKVLITIRIKMSEEGPATISGPDSEEILMDLVTKYSPRNVIALHRAILSSDLAAINEILSTDATLLERTLLPVESFAEISKCNAMDTNILEAIPEIHIQTEPFPEVLQFTTGDSDKPNELFPNGEYDEPETNLDTVFWTPLLRACQIGSPTIVDLLISRGANRDYQSPSKACTLSVLTAMGLSTEVDDVVAIIQAVATPVNAAYGDYITPILGSEDFDSTVEIITALLDAGCYISRESGLPDEDLSWLEDDVAELVRNYFDEHPSASGGGGKVAKALHIVDVDDEDELDEPEEADEVGGPDVVDDDANADSGDEDEDEDKDENEDEDEDESKDEDASDDDSESDGGNIDPRKRLKVDH